MNPRIFLRFDEAAPKEVKAYLDRTRTSPEALSPIID